MSIVSKAKGILKVGGNYCLHDWCAWFDKLTMREVEDCRSQDLHRWPLIMQPIIFPHGELVEPRTKLLHLSSSALDNVKTSIDNGFFRGTLAAFKQLFRRSFANQKSLGKNS